KIHGTACKHRNPPPRLCRLKQRHAVPERRAGNIYAHFMQRSETPEFMHRQYFPKALKKFQDFEPGGGLFESKPGRQSEKSSFIAGCPETLSPLVYSIGNTYSERTKCIARPA